jgi:AcrR family transcriptional regulator
MFEKRGRPAEDRLARQRDIFMAVAPLIERGGARRLKMRDAANAAHMSLGGLYHYFPGKRDLVLHALQPEAFARLCKDFYAESWQLRDSDPDRFLIAYVDFQVRESFFIRPAFLAAMELGVAVVMDAVDSGIEAGLQIFVEPLRSVAAELTDAEVEALGKSLRRSLYASMLDRRTTPDELRADLLALIAGVRYRRASTPARAEVDAHPLGAGVSK